MSKNYIKIIGYSKVVPRRKLITVADMQYKLHSGFCCPDLGAIQNVVSPLSAASYFHNWLAFENCQAHWMDICAWC